MHRMRCDFATTLAKAGLTLAAAVIATLGNPAPRSALADLIRPTAAQSFPDLDGDIAATQRYTYDPSTATGTFQVNSAPTLLALGPNVASEYTINDTASAPRSESLQLVLDSSGHLLTNNPGNTFSLYGSVTINGQNYSGLLLQGTPTQFGYASPSSGSPSMSVYDLNMTLTGGKLQQLYGPDAYMRIIAETNSTFTGSFNQSFLGMKAKTNVRAYDALGAPAPIPEPSTLAILTVCFGAMLASRHRRRHAARKLASHSI